MNVPIKRGTARRLGIPRPLRPGEYWAPLPGLRGVAVTTAPIALGTARRLGLRTPGWSDESRYRFYRQRWATGIDADTLSRSNFNMAAVDQLREVTWTLGEQWPAILDDPAARIRAATAGWAVSVAEATQGAAEFCAALRRRGGQP